MPAQRLQKLIATAGLASRRRAEEWIVAGRVAVDGVVCRDLGHRADPESQRVTVDGRPLPRAGRLYLALHKPAGVVSSLRDPHAQAVIPDLLSGMRERVYPVGRLDRDSEGLLILTNDGELMQAVTRPGGGVDKVYEVTVRWQPSAATLDALRAGPEIEGRRLLPCEIDVLRVGQDETVLRVVLHEGKKNQIRRMFAAAGHRVRRLVRRQIGPVHLGDLAAGAWRHLTSIELHRLRAAAGLRPGGTP